MIMLLDVQKVPARVAERGIMGQFWVQFCLIQISETLAERLK